MATFGVVVFSLPGTKYIDQCLKSVEWADSIVVHSLDENRWDRQTQPSFPEGSTDWVLHLWGDERVESGLQDELLMLSRRDLRNASLFYRLPIRTYCLTRWVQGSLWGPNPAVRLSRKVERLPEGWWNAEQRKDQNASERLHGWIGDYSFAELSHGIAQMNRISTLWANVKQSDGKTANAVAAALFSARLFLRLWTLNRLVSSGLPGLTVSVLSAYMPLLTAIKQSEAAKVFAGEQTARRSIPERRHVE